MTLFAIIIRENHLHIPNKMFNLNITRIMKKFFIFAVCALMSATASAVEFSFASIDKVAQEGKGFVAYAGGESVKISALQYMQMKDAVGYYLLSVDGEKVVAAGNEFVVEPLVADSVGLDGTQPKVFFTNGTTKTFTKAEWLKTLKGQKVRRIYINIQTWEFENFATVNKGQVVVYHDKVAPVKAQVSAKVVVPAPAPAKVVAPAQSANGNFGGITFKVTH